MSRTIECLSCPNHPAMDLPMFLQHMVETHGLFPERKPVAECSYLAQELHHQQEPLWFGNVLRVWFSVDTSLAYEQARN